MHHQSRPHVIASSLVCVLALAVAGCTAASIHDDDGSSSTTSPSRGAPVPVPSGGGTEIAGVSVSGADGYTADGHPMADIAETPEIANLDADLRLAVARAIEAAAADGVEVRINSGWRSARYQQALLDQAVEEHGSLREARRWVNTPERSAHVQGRAVDVGAVDAAAWMQEHGSAFGLCQTYENESWHYELSTDPGGTCPAMLRDSTAG